MLLGNLPALPAPGKYLLVPGESDARDKMLRWTANPSKAALARVIGDRDGGNDQCGIHSLPCLPQRDGNPPDLSRCATAIAPLATRYFSPAIWFLGVLHE